MKKRLRILGTGSHVPERRVPNSEFAKTLDTSDEWIRERTGIEERRLSSDQEPTSVFAIEAAKKALDAAKIKPEDVDLILAATTTPDMLFPSLACLVQEGTGAKKAFAFDVSAACAGFLYGLQVAHTQAQAGAVRTVLLVGADTLGKYCDFTDRGTCILFGDGAGAAVLRSEEGERGILGAKLYSDGTLWRHLYIANSGSVSPNPRDTQGKRTNFIKMEGREVFRYAVRGMTESCKAVMDECGVAAQDVRWLIAHQANSRILDSTAEKLAFPKERVYQNLQKYGNTSAASIPLALDECSREGKLAPGDLILFTAFGAGFAWGSALVRW